MPLLCRNRGGRGGCNAKIKSSIYYHFLRTTGVNLPSQNEAALPRAWCVWLADGVRAAESVQSPYTSEGKNTSQERSNGLQVPLHHRSQSLFQHTHDKLIHSRLLQVSSVTVTVGGPDVFLCFYVHKLQVLTI